MSKPKPKRVRKLKTSMMLSPTAMRELRAIASYLGVSRSAALEVIIRAHHRMTGDYE